MEIKWYWLAEQLGLVTDISSQYQDGWIHYQVSSSVSDVFFALLLALLPTLFLLGFLAGFLSSRRGNARLGKTLLRGGVLLLLSYALLLTVGIGPYVQLYPRGGSFLDLDTIEHILQGAYCALLAITFFFGGRFGYFLTNRCTKRTENP